MEIHPSLLLPLRKKTKEVSHLLPHLPQEIVLLDLTPPLLPHRSRQLLLRLICHFIPLDRAIRPRKINTLLIQRNFRRQRFRIEQLLFLQSFGS